MSNPNLYHDLQAAERESQNNASLSFKPYPKQKAFLDGGATQRIRAFMAANRSGKTFTGSMEGAYHLTGNYPRWWKGKRFDTPIQAWTGSDTAEATRDILQEAYLGGKNPESFGTGSIPKSKIERWTRRQGIADAIDTVWVRHKSGGLSELTFKSYDQGREKWQGTARHFIHLDEEPPMPIWSESFIRTATTKGHIILTFTPLKGMSEVVDAVMAGKQEVKIGNTTRTVEIGFYQSGWKDCPHLTEDDMFELLAGIPEYEREARMEGKPSVGRGRIYPFKESDITVEPFELPKEWLYFYGMDFGWRNTAAVFFAVDPNTETYYIYDEYKAGELPISEHAVNIKMRGGEWQNGVADPAGNQSQRDGDNYLNLFRSPPNSLKLTDADNSVEAGLQDCLNLFRTGKLKIFTSCPMILHEASRYARDDKGKVIKKDDHLLDAARYGVRSGRKKGRMKTQKKRFNNRFNLSKVTGWTV